MQLQKSGFFFFWVQAEQLLPSLPIHQHLHLATNGSKNTTSGIFLRLSNRSLLIMLGDATDIYLWAEQHSLQKPFSRAVSHLHKPKRKQLTDQLFKSFFFPKDKNQIFNNDGSKRVLRKWRNKANKLTLHLFFTNFLRLYKSCGRLFRGCPGSLFLPAKERSHLCWQKLGQIRKN